MKKSLWIGRNIYEHAYHWPANSRLTWATHSGKQLLIPAEKQRAVASGRTPCCRQRKRGLFVVCRWEDVVGADEGEWFRRLELTVKSTDWKIRGAKWRRPGIVITDSEPLICGREKKQLWLLCLMAQLDPHFTLFGFNSLLMCDAGPFCNLLWSFFLNEVSHLLSQYMWLRCYSVGVSKLWPWDQLQLMMHF